MTAEASMLEVTSLGVRYGQARALSDVSFTLGAGQTLAVIGANGAGKSTLARCLSGLVPADRGSFSLDSKDLTRASAARIRRAGLVHLPEGRGVFPSLSVKDNIGMAIGLLRNRPERQRASDRAFEMFPALRDRLTQAAGTLSGGEQQMLSLARAFVTSPRLIIADELSLGLAPKMVDLVFDSLGRAREAGVSILLIEQFAHRALEFADRALILLRGELVWSGDANGALDQAARIYLGDAVQTS